LRVAAWNEKLPGVLRVSSGAWSDAHDEHALHWVIFESARVIAAARMCVHDVAASAPDSYALRPYSGCIPAPFACLNRLVVSPDARGRGLAAALDVARVAAARELGCRAVVAATHGNRRQALSSAGFERLGRVAYPVDHPLNALGDAEELFVLGLNATTQRDADAGVRALGV